MLDFLYYAVSWVLLRWHDLMTFLGLDETGGTNWALSIVMLVVTARLLLFRLFIRQVHFQRRMQEMQPRLQAIREKYKNDKAAQQREIMALQQQEGFNPLAGCLPLVAQLPVFIGLLHVLRHLATASNPGYPDPLKELYGFTRAQTENAAAAKVFGAPLSANFHDTGGIIERLAGDVSTTRIVITILLLVSAAATYLTQRQVMARATVPAEGQAALIQKAMLYLIPVGVLASGFIFNFPLGVLLYWFTSNLWTMAQQFYINKVHPNTPVPAAAGAASTGKALAPKPGAKPNRAKNAPSTAAAGGPDLTKGDAASSNGSANGSVNGKAAARTSAPKPGQKPLSPRGGSSPGSGRPSPGRRSGPAKKRR